MIIKNFRIDYSLPKDLIDCIYDFFQPKNEEILKVLSDDSVPYPTKMENLVTLLSTIVEEKSYYKVTNFLISIKLENINKIPIELRLKVLDLIKEKPRLIYTTPRMLEELARHD